MSEIDSTLNERGARYGDYSDVAGTTQQLVSIVECGASYEHLNAEQKTSLFMICNKIARAVNGDPQYFDNYRDIAGYATLAERACEQGRLEVIESLKAQLNNMEACYIEKKKECEEWQKTNISLEAGLRKNSKNKQKLLGKNIELQKRIDEYEKLTTSIRNEFDLWSDDSEFADVIEAQIENLEALRGES